MKLTKQLVGVVAVVATTLGLMAGDARCQDRIPWITNLQTAIQQSQATQRLVLLHFWSETCQPCRRMDQQVFSKPEVIRTLSASFIPVKINTSERQELAAYYKVATIPTDLIVTPSGQVVYRSTGALDANAYIAMLDGVRGQVAVSGDQMVSPLNASNTTAQLNHGDQTSISSPVLPDRGLVENGYAPAGATAGQDSGGYAAQSNPYVTGPPQPAPSASQYAPAPQESLPSGLPQQTANYAPRYGDAIPPAANSSTPTMPVNDPGYQRGPNLPDPRMSPPPPSGLASYGNPVGSPSFSPPRPQPGLSAAPGAPIPGTSIPGAPAAAPQFALEAHCPVTLVHGQVWSPGDKRWGAVHNGLTYLFVGQAEQQAFLANPNRYAALLQGYDPVRYLRTGQLVPGKREFGLFVPDHGIALFADEQSLVEFENNSAYYVDAALRQVMALREAGMRR